jgi:hypothetical protein
MSKFIISILFLVFTQALFAVDVGSRTNSDNCAGALLSFFNRDSKYTSYKNLPEVMPEKLKGNLYSESGQISKFSKYRRAFFSSLVSKEIDKKNVAKPLSKLNQNELYTFVITEKEIRFATTSRGSISPKNFSSKHALLANGEKVHFAGEVWFENGVLVVNNNSGTFKPKGEDLADVAKYFQDVFGVEKVIFSDEIPVAKKLSFKSIMDDFKAFVKAHRSTVKEGVINLFARDRYLGKTIQLKNAAGELEIELVVSEFIGSGVFGAVHKLKVIKLSDSAKKNYPFLFSGAEVRDDLVIKFPHNIPLLKYLPVEDVFNKTVIRENDEIIKLKPIIEEFEQDAADILYKGELDGKTFLVKNFVKASSIQKMASTQKKLTKEQEIALKRDIFDMALAVKERMGAILDIKAENVAWDESHKKFVMYELSLKEGNAHTDAGLDGYLRYYNDRMSYWSNKRKPSSVEGEIKLCAENQTPIPENFKASFNSGLVDGNFDLTHDQIVFNQSDLKGCFVVKEVTYYQGFTQLNLLFNKDFSRRQQIEFGILSDDSNKTYEMAFALFENNKILGTSYLYSVEAR